MQNATLRQLSNAPNFMSFDLTLGSYGGFLAAPVLPTYSLKSELPVLPGWRTMDVCHTNCNAVLVRLCATADGRLVGGGLTCE